MDHIADMNADLDFDSPVRSHIMIALGKCALNLNGTLCCFERAVKLDEKSISDRLDLRPVEARKK